MQQKLLRMTTNTNQDENITQLASEKRNSGAATSKDDHMMGVLVSANWDSKEFVAIAILHLMILIDHNHQISNIE